MLRINSIYTESIVDGEDLRYAIFFQGCNHKCKGCHNPESWDFSGGTEKSLKELEDEFDNSYSENWLLDGITLTGGDPFFQAKEITEFAKHVHEMGLTVWAYTGFDFDEFVKFIKGEACDNRINNDMIELLKNIDVLVDRPFILDKRSISLKYKGSTNQRIIDIKKSLEILSAVEYEC